MQKNIILAIALSVVIIVIYNVFLMPRFEAEKEVTETPQVKEQVGESIITIDPTGEKPLVAQGKPITLENENIILTINTEGGKITSWYLKEKKTNIVGEEGKAIRFYLKLADDEIIDFSGADFRIREKDDRKVVFFWEDRERELTVTETIELPEQGYHIFYNLSLNYPLNLQCYLLCPAEIVDRTNAIERLAFWENQLYEEKKGGIRPDYNNRVKWLGIRDKKDFLITLIPLNRVDKGVFNIDSWNYWGFTTTRQRTSWVIYAGPQNYSYVRLVNNFIKDNLGEDYHLLDALNIGIWGYLSIGIIKLLIFFYSFTHNYGVAIILLTLLIYGALSPLTFKQFESMHKMQLVQPQLKKIQKEFKSDPKKMQAEIMKMYREHKVNPISGCLPMVFQLPIIFILYRALLGFPFAENPSFLWIANLGKPNIPLLLGLGGLMFLQQRVSQKVQTSKEQEGIAKMMQFFPLFLIFILWSLPSGVMLYWFTSTLISITQQLFISKRTRGLQIKPKK